MWSTFLQQIGLINYHELVLVCLKRPANERKEIPSICFSLKFIVQCPVSGGSSTRFFRFHLLPFFTHRILIPLTALIIIIVIIITRIVLLANTGTWLRSWTPHTLINFTYENWAQTVCVLFAVCMQYRPIHSINKAKHIIYAEDTWIGVCGCSCSCVRDMCSLKCARRSMQITNIKWNKRLEWKVKLCENQPSNFQANVANGKNVRIDFGLVGRTVATGPSKYYSLYFEGKVESCLFRTAVEMILRCRSCGWSDGIIFYLRSIVSTYFLIATEMSNETLAVN